MNIQEHIQNLERENRSLKRQLENNKLDGYEFEMQRMKASFHQGLIALGVTTVTIGIIFLGYLIGRVI